MLSACASKQAVPADEAAVYDTHDAYVALAETADSVSRTLTDLKSTEQAAKPPKSLAPLPNPSTYGMSMLASIDWNGPVKPIVQQIANATGYQLHVLGREPSIPIVVSVRTENEPIGYILRDIGYQCGSRADIVLFPSRHIIELRYAQE